MLGATKTLVVATLFTFLTVYGVTSCGTPPSVANAQVSRTVVNSLEIATYTCNAASGYASRGNKSIACLRAHGYTVWTPVQVRCERVQCSSSPSMAHATHDFQRRVTKSRTGSEYRCDYYRYGRCQSRSHYYVRQYYADTEMRTIYYTGHVKFTCQTNYFLANGSTEVLSYCGDDGQWITPGQVCEGKDCGRSQTMVGVTCAYSSSRYPVQRSCRCSSGYERDNSLSFTISCQPSGTWSGPRDGGPTTCTRISCGNPPVVPNSDRAATRTTGTSYEDTVTYTCLPGYEVKSMSNTTSCQADRRWSATPQCTRKDCRVPPDIGNGGVQRHLYNTTFDSEVTYSCESLGYVMVGSPVVRCSEDGTWSTIPQCHRVNCGSPAIVPNSQREVFGHSYGDNVTYVCNSGYLLERNQTIYCQVNGHWTVPPVCKGSSCGIPPSVTNAHNISLVSGTSVGDEVTYVCLSGYEPDGDSTVECQANQEWSPLPQCHRIRCGDPPAVLDGVRHVRGHYYMDSTLYQCQPGYLMSGNPLTYCQQDGHWSTPPDCHIISCGVPPIGESARIRTISGFQIGDTIQYQCVQGYTIIGHVDFVTCQFNGSWSDPPNCVGRRLFPAAGRERTSTSTHADFETDIFHWSSTQSPPMSYGTKEVELITSARTTRTTAKASTTVPIASLPSYHTTTKPTTPVLLVMENVTDTGLREVDIKGDSSSLPRSTASVTQTLLEISSEKSTQPNTTDWVASIATSMSENSTQNQRSTKGILHGNSSTLALPISQTVTQSVSSLVTNSPQTLINTRASPITGHQPANQTQQSIPDSSPTQNFSIARTTLKQVTHAIAIDITTIKPQRHSTRLSTDYLETSTETRLSSPHRTSSSIKVTTADQLTTLTDDEASSSVTVTPITFLPAAISPTPTIQSRVTTKQHYQIFNVSVRPTVAKQTFDFDVTPPNNNNATNKTTKMRLRNNQAQVASKAAASTNHRTSDVQIIGFTALGVGITLFIMAATWWKFVRKRSRGEHSFSPISNALYESNGEVMTVYSFKEGRGSAEPSE